MFDVPGICMALPIGEPSALTPCACGPRWPVAFEYQAIMVPLASLATFGS